MAKPKARLLKNDTELKLVASLDNAEYSDESINYEGLLSWWRAYPDGISILMEGSKVIGAFGIWPVTKKLFDMLVEGTIDEVGITGHDIIPKQDAQSWTYWYVGDIVIAKWYRRYKRCYILLETAIQRWVNNTEHTENIELCALGFSGIGEKLLMRFNFTKSEERCPAGKPVYVRTLDIHEARGILQEVNSEAKYFIDVLTDGILQGK